MPLLPSKIFYKEIGIYIINVCFISFTGLDVGYEFSFS